MAFGGPRINHQLNWWLLTSIFTTLRLMYHFGNEHAECNVYLLRYLRKNSDKTGNSWSTEMIYLLADANSRRKELFLRDADVKFYNNDSERNLRKCKTHQKMSDGFRERKWQ